MAPWRDPPGVPRGWLLTMIVAVVAIAHVLLLAPSLEAPTPVPSLLPPVPPYVALEEARPAPDLHPEGAGEPPPPPPETRPPEKAPEPENPVPAEGGEETPDGGEARLAAEMAEVRDDPRAGELARAILGEKAGTAPTLVFVMGDREKLEVPAAFGEEFLAIPQRDDGLYFRIDTRRWTFEAVRERGPDSAVVHEKDYDRFRSLPPRIAELRRRIERDPRCNGGIYFFGTRLSEVEKRLVARRIAAELERRGGGGRPGDVERVKLRYRPEGRLYDVEVVDLRLREPDEEEGR